MIQKSPPIVVIYLPDSHSALPGTALELMKALNGWDDTIDKSKRDKKLDSYIWFCFYKSGIEAPEFKVFYPKNFTKIQYAELKQMVEDHVRQATKNN